MNTVELFPSCEGILRKKRKKHGEISLLCFESCCDVFGIEGGKGAPMRTRPYSCNWINYWLGLLLLLDYYVFFFMKIGSSKVWKNNRKMAILVFLDLGSELCLGRKYFLSWKWKRKKWSKSAICPVLQHGGSDPIIQWIKNEKTDFDMFSFYFWLGTLYTSKAIAPSLSFSFEKFTHYQIGALQRQWALGRAR